MVSGPLPGPMQHHNTVVPSLGGRPPDATDPTLREKLNHKTHPSSIAWRPQTNSALQRKHNNMSVPQ